MTPFFLFGRPRLKCKMHQILIFKVYASGLHYLLVLLKQALLLNICFILSEQLAMPVYFLLQIMS